MSRPRATFDDCQHGPIGCDAGCQCPCDQCAEDRAAALDHAQHTAADIAHFAQRED